MNIFHVSCTFEYVVLRSIYRIYKELQKVTKSYGKFHIIKNISKKCKP
jgi:hypothetical protein